MLYRLFVRTDNEYMMEPELKILQSLNQLLQSPGIAAEINNIVDRIELRFQDSPELLAWETVPLNVYGGSLPNQIRSSWVFLLREGCASGAERHPNSHQRVRSWRGTGDFQTRTDEKWDSHILKSGFSGPLEEQWASIPVNVWHQAVVERGKHWIVVSFHTARAEELIEERPDSHGADRFHQRTYVSR